MAIREQLVEYRDRDVLLEAFFCHNESRPVLSAYAGVHKIKMPEHYRSSLGKDPSCID